MVEIILYDIPPAQIRGNSKSKPVVKRIFNRSRREVAYALGLEAKQNNPSALQGELEVYYKFYHWRKVDIDNCLIGMKSTLDGIVDSGVIEADNPTFVARSVGEFEQCKKGDSKTIIKIKEMIKND